MCASQCTVRGFKRKFFLINITLTACHYINSTYIVCRVQGKIVDIYLVFESPVVTVCTTQWSLYVPHSGHYMYHTVVTICTAQWSLYVPHSGHYMYHTVVTICTAQWSLYVPHSGHYMYHTVVTICTTSLTSNNSTFCPHSCIYVFCVDLRTNSHYFPIKH